MNSEIRITVFDVINRAIFKNTDEPKCVDHYDLVIEQIRNLAPAGAIGYRAMCCGRRFPTKEDHGRDFFALSDYPTGVIGSAQLIYVDSGLKPIVQPKPPFVEIGPLGTQAKAISNQEDDDGGYVSLGDELDRHRDESLYTQEDFVAEHNRLNLRQKRLRNVREARLASRMDATLETVHGLVSDSIQRIADIDHANKVHTSEAGQSSCWTNLLS